jgi:hypothetical protein
MNGLNTSGQDAMLISSFLVGKSEINWEQLKIRRQKVHQLRGKHGGFKAVDRGGAVLLTQTPLHKDEKRKSDESDD